MMNSLKGKIQRNEDTSLEEVFNFFESTDDIFLLKYDGPRETDLYTVVIIAGDNRFESIRTDQADRETAISESLTRYFNLNS